MKRSNDQSLKDAIQELLHSYQLKEKVNELRLKENWEKMFGKTISKYTSKILVRDRKLFLTIESAPLRQELTYSKAKMMERINEEIENDFVREIVIR